jgi:hypothetical protein
MPPKEKKKIAIVTTTSNKEVKSGQPLLYKKDSDGNYNCRPLYQDTKKK